MTESVSSGQNAVPAWLQDQLLSLLQQRGHALLLSGPPGLGQYPLAYALAKAWLCDQPTPAGACGQCASCHSVDVRAHPDLHVLLPETVALELNWPLPSAAQDEIDKKSRKPSRWIRVEAARAAVAFTQMTRARSRFQVVLIYPAQRLNVESANTLLKTLEEPPGDVRFVLATEASHMLLPTIRSRCLTHNMSWPSTKTSQQWLETTLQPTPSPETATTWLQAAGGRPMDALTWAELGLTHAQWSSLPKSIAKGQLGHMQDWTPAVILDTLQKVAHDTQSAWVGATPRFFAAADLPTLPHLRALEQWALRLSTWRRTVEHPYNAGLQTEAWLCDAAIVFATAAKPQRAGSPTPH
jgi:DNA polymerase-3 subunit delta'